MIENKTDEVFLKINDLLRNLSDKITPNIILFVALTNGVILGFITTGYLGASSIPIKSFTFILFIWQFVIICFFSAKYVNLTTAYLHKFAMCGVIGYAFQWQTFGMYAASYDAELLKSITPLQENGFSTALFFYFCFLGVKYCFSGNNQTTGNTKKYELEK
jgi:hypothetical protein